MVDAIIQGIFLGLVLSVFVGPVFFMLVQTSVSQGVNAALILDAGIVCSDVFCIALCYFGLAQVMEQPAFRLVFGISGGAVLMIYGIYSLLAKPKTQSVAIPKGLTKAHGLKLFFKGFIFNASVPSVIFFWLGTVSLAIAQFENNLRLTVAYLSSVVLTYLVLDILKIYLASKARKFFSDEKQHIVKKFAGAALLIFGVVIILRVFQGA